MAKKTDTLDSQVVELLLKNTKNPAMPHQLKAHEKSMRYKLDVELSSR